LRSLGVSVLFILTSLTYSTQNQVAVLNPQRESLDWYSFLPGYEESPKLFGGTRSPKGYTVNAYCAVSPIDNTRLRIFSTKVFATQGEAHVRVSRIGTAARSLDPVLLHPGFWERGSILQKKRHTFF
jgi:hypothetical protein